MADSFESGSIVHSDDGDESASVVSEEEVEEIKPKKSKKSSKHDGGVKGLTIDRLEYVVCYICDNLQLLYACLIQYCVYWRVCTHLLVILIMLSVTARWLS